MIIRGHSMINIRNLSTPTWSLSPTLFNIDYVGNNIFWLVSEGPFAKSICPHGSFVSFSNWITCLPTSHKFKVGKLHSPSLHNCQVHITTSTFPSCHLRILLFDHIGLYFTLWNAPNKSSSLPSQIKQLNTTICLITTIKPTSKELISILNVNVTLTSTMWRYWPWTLPPRFQKNFCWPNRS
jgi:hypothetical protein